MSKTLLIGPNAVTALVSQAASEIFTSENCAVVFNADGTYRSWQPNRVINSFTDLEVGAGYIAIMKDTLDVTGVFSEGIPGIAQAGVYNLSQYDLTLFDLGSSDTSTLASGDFLPQPDGDAYNFEVKAVTAGIYGVIHVPTNPQNVVYWEGGGNFAHVGATSQFFSFNAASFNQKSIYIILDVHDSALPPGAPENEFYFFNGSADDLSYKENDIVIATIAAGTGYKRTLTQLTGKVNPEVTTPVTAGSYKVARIDNLNTGENKALYFDVAGAPSSNVEINLSDITAGNQFFFLGPAGAFGEGTIIDIPA
jgi:hypothetical protein